MKPLKDASMPADTADEVNATKKINGIQQKQSPPKRVSQEKSFEILEKPLETISGGVLFSGCKTATLVKEILMNKPFSVNDYKHL